MKRKQILIVEDEEDIAHLLATQFTRQGAIVTRCSSGEEALESLREKTLDLIVLDWMLPGMSGFEVVQAMRLKSGVSSFDVPILMLTAKDDPQEIVLAIDAGANDYVTKPFDLSVLLARARALLRGNQTSGAMEPLHIGSLVLSPEDQRVRIGEQSVSLTRSEFQILFFLASNPGRVLTRQSLLERVQTKEKDVTLRIVDTHVFGLRRKLGTAGDLIETIRGIGYRILHPAPEADEEIRRIFSPL